MERSVSRDVDESDGESRGESNAPGKPGRKKNPNSQAARRDQNRIAQREFRLRKQQRIRDLEARVELLSGGQDEALGEMRDCLKDLMQENQTLRNLLKSLAGFIGEGAGGLLPKLGWEMSDFNSFVNKSETDTAWEGYQRRKKNGESSLPGGKRSLDDDAAGPRSKKSRPTDADNQYSVLVPMPQSNTMGNNSVYQLPRASMESGMFSDMMKTNGTAAIFGSPPAPQYGGAPASGYQPSSYIPNANVPLDSLPPISFPPNNGTSQQKQSQLSADQIIEDDDDPNKNEAYKLIHYHLDNFKRNSAYCLPSSLRPTLVQRTVPHEGVIDRILHPELRDRMILLRGRFDLVDCLLEYRSAVTIHGDDVLAHSNWEVNEKWLRQYGFLVDSTTLGIMNRWRRERGESELRMSDISSEATT
ncbi:hypothetical protein C8J56DRAFT_935078 [Mycena floridula]|nr:hypothetical protein C8J56DRAFT_935078 [Mycena floridula]